MNGYSMSKLMKRIVTSFVAIGIGAGMGMSVEAAVEGPLGCGNAVETFSANYGSCASPLTGGDSENVILNDFNPSLGTLMGVTLTLISSDAIESEVINLTAQSQAYSGATATLPVTITALDGLTTTATGVAGPFSGVTANPEPGTTVAGTSRVTTTTSVNAAGGDFILYEGTGTFAVNVSALDGVYSGSSAGNTVAFFGAGDAWGTVEVAYDYCAVPEPGTLAAGLGLLGYCGLSLARRTRIATRAS
jgi:hypothetical protein